MHSDLKGKGMKINHLTDYYKSFFSILFRGIISNPSVSTDNNFPYVVRYLSTKYWPDRYRRDKSVKFGTELP